MENIIKNIILEFHKDGLPSLFERSITFPLLPKELRKAIVFIGMRRVGKTYLMYQHMNKLLLSGIEKQKLLYINFEDDRLNDFSIHHFQMILDIYFEIYPNYIQANDLYFYFDEIQNIDGWEKFIRRLLDKEKVNLIITGSSSKLLSKEIATSLRGRCLKTEIFPLRFVEYLQYHKIDKLHNLTNKEQSVIRHYSQKYLKYGSFPETLSLSKNLHHEVIQSYVNAAVFRDVIDRYELNNPHIVKVFLLQCLQNIAAPLSITKIYKTLKSRGESLTRSNLYKYLQYFEDAYLICTTPIFELSTRKRQVNPPKIYCIDSGIIQSYSIKPQMEHGACLENATYIHLRQLDFEHIFYYKTASGKEIDFIAQKPNGKIELYQVCIDLTDEKTKQRELTALIEAAKELQVDHGFIITSNELKTLTIDNITIHILPYWKWTISS